MQTEMEMEERSLKSEIAMGKVMLSGQQNKMAEMLTGDMGRDMFDVLDGKVKVTLPWKQRVKFWFQSRLRKLIGKTGEIDG